MRTTLLNSLLDLAHATSANLGFAHKDDVLISYGEETITETNLLELRRRHPGIVNLRTFGKKKEALNGADWEWHIIGLNRKLRMRVQAKRLQKDNKLKIPHKVASSGAQQIDLLIADAKAHRLKPLYCLYSSESQRTIWQKSAASAGAGEFEYGCLLASAHDVKAKMPKTLSAIEANCVPWHYLVERRRYAEKRVVDFIGDGVTLSFLSAVGTSEVVNIHDEATTTAYKLPTVGELNAVARTKISPEGVAEVGSPEYDSQMSDEAYRERGISRLIEIDVRDFDSEH